MKQFISPEQLMELTPEQKEKLREWWVPGPGQTICVQYGDGSHKETSLGEYWGGLDGVTNEISYRDPGCGCCSDDLDIADALPLLSIGQLIELLRAAASKMNGTLFMNQLIDDDEVHYVWRITLLCGGDSGHEFKAYVHEAHELTDALWQAVKEVL